MKHQRLLSRMIGAMVISLILVACSTSQVAPTQTPPTDTPTKIPPTDVPTSVPPTDIPTTVPPTDIPTTVPPTSMGGSWTSGADIPTPRWEHYTCVVDGKIYVIGGAGPVYEALGTVEVYDPTTDTWETKSPMPTARQGLSASVVNGKIYAIGGAEFSSASFSNSEKFSTVEEYDPSTDTWTTRSPMPTARGWHSANVVDGKIYIIAGAKGASPSGGHIQTVEVYDPTTDTWSQKGDMPAPRGAGSGSVLDGKIHFFGGYGGRQRVDEYDPSTDTWTQKSDMPTARVGLSTSTLDGKIYLIGGFGQSGYKGQTTVDVYDPATDTWTTAPDMPTGRFGAYTSAVDGKIYVFGGLPNWPGSTLGIVEIYEP